MLVPLPPPSVPPVSSISSASTVLEKVKASNLKTYGNEEGPTAESLYEKYGSWERVLQKAFSMLPGQSSTPSPTTAPSSTPSSTSLSSQAASATSSASGACCCNFSKKKLLSSKGGQAATTHGGATDI